jgi:hypothetical protein
MPPSLGSPLYEKFLIVFLSFIFQCSFLFCTIEKSQNTLFTENINSDTTYCSKARYYVYNFMLLILRTLSSKHFCLKKYTILHNKWNSDFSWPRFWQCGYILPWLPVFEQSEELFYSAGFRRHRRGTHFV